MNDESDRHSSFIFHLSSLVTDHRIILFGGKGGVGKTTIASAAALHRAQTRPTILFTTDPASNLSDIFAEPVPNLTIEELDAQQLYARFLQRNLIAFLELGDRGTYLEKDELKRFFELSLPGVDELMAWMHIGELAEEHPNATIVVDTAPTGHTLRMLGAGNHFRQLAAALDAMQEKHREFVRQFTRRDVRDAMDAFVEQFTAEAERHRALLTSSVFIPVFLAEPWVVDQTRRLIAEVRGDGLEVPLAVLNRYNGRMAEVGVPVATAERACVPLDTPERIRTWSAGLQPAVEAASLRPGRLEATRTAGRMPAVREVSFFAGKGGVGKTTLSCSVALQLAKREKHVTLLSIDPAHSVKDVFANQTPPPNLAVETIDTRAMWQAFRATLGEEIERAASAITPSGTSVAYDAEAMRKLVEIAPPGADELFAIRRLADLIAEGETTVVDTAPTGHFLRLIDLPKTAGEWVHELMRILLRYKELVPPGSLGEELVRASRALASVNETLRSDRCAVFVVTRPERIVVAETKRLTAELERRGIRVSGIVANYVTPDSDDPCDRSMRAFEDEALASFSREVVIIERREAPVVRLEELEMLLPRSP